MASTMFDSSLSSIPSLHESVAGASSQSSSSLNHIFIEHNYACLLLSTTFGKRIDEPDHGDYNLVEIKTEEVSSMVETPPIVNTYTAISQSLQAPTNQRSIKKEVDDNETTPSQRSQRQRRKPKRWDDETTSELASDQNNTSINKENEKQDEDETEDDPNKLWCICQRPHNNRFMISCDSCSEWFHGKCVNITKAKATALENQDIKWYCPTCKVSKSQANEGNIAMVHQDIIVTQEPAESSVDDKSFQKASERIKSHSKSPTDVPQPLSSPKPPHSAPSNSISTPRKSMKGDESSTDRKILSKKIPNEKRPTIGDVIMRKKLKEAGSKAAYIERKQANHLKKLIRSKKMNLEKKLDKSSKSAKQQTPEAEKQENKWEPIGKVVPLTKKIDEKKKKSKVTPVDPSFNDLFKAEPLMMTKKINPTSYPSTPTTPSGSNIKRSSVSGLPHSQKKLSSEQHCVSCSKLVPKAAIGGKEASIYCSEVCLEKHVKEHVEIFKKTRAQSSSTNGNKSGKIRITVFEKSSQRILSGDNSIPEDQVLEYVKANPTYEVFLSTSYRRQSSSGSIDIETKKKEAKVTPSSSKTSVKRKDESALQRQKSGESNTPKSEAKKDDPESVRANVRKTLKEILETRRHEADNRQLSVDIDKIADKIELELFNFWNKTTVGKYVVKYRCLRFNLKDPKNQGLFRKVLTGSITPEKLVRMTPDELASPELAKWRERETKHAIEMIKRDAQAMSQQVIVKKTHKGEEVIEKKTVLTNPETTAIEDESTRKLSKPTVAASNSFSTPSNQKEKPFSGLDLLPDDLLFKDDKRKELDTTDKHHQHLFDAHCKICNNESKTDLPAAPIQKPKSIFHKSDDVKPSQPKRVRVEFDVEPMTKIFDQNLEVNRSDKINERTNNETSEDQSSKLSPANFGKQPKPKHKSTCWRGFIHFPDVAKFFSSAHEVYGLQENRLKDVPDTIHVCGRIAPEQAIDYLKMISSEDMAVVKFVYGSTDDRRGYDKFFQYLYERKRYGVVGKIGKSIKDFYILPLPKETNPPDAILPPDGLNFENNRENLLLGVLVKNKKHMTKMPAKEKPPTHAKYEITNHLPRDPPERSFTPPPPESMTSTDVAMAEPNVEVEQSTNQVPVSEVTMNEATMSQSDISESTPYDSIMIDTSKNEEPAPYIPGLGLTPSPKQDDQNDEKPLDDLEEPYDPEAYTPEYIPAATSTSTSYYSV